MPIYEYFCDECEQDEIELLIRADEVPECPSCGGKKLTKKMSIPAAHSGKGGGLPVMPPGGG